MCEHWRKIAKKTKNSRLVRVLEGELGKVGKTRKQKVLLIFILAVLAGLFFSVLFGGNAAAKRVVQVKSPNLFEMDPLEKVGKGFVKEVEVEKVCLETEARKKEEEVKRDEKKEKYLNLIEDHPMERMIEPLLEKDENVSAFLIGIAKKESDWGKHSPKKNGRECFNYWGYKGKHDTTASGYSCFDSPEQAVDVVGGRIEDLIGKKVDTPERMIVWKCGSTCAGHDPASVRKWISDVSQYYYKLKT
jgi:hypothetical protein